MKVSIITGDGDEHNFDDCNAAFYSELTDTFNVHRFGRPIFECKMGEISEIEIYGR